MDQYYEPPTFTEEELDNCVVDEPANGRFEVARKMFDDPVIFDLEMQHIFAATWVYLGHESQVAKPYDYLSARIGPYPVLVTRNGQGKINAFLNTCSHRGAKLTTDKRGNKKAFMCPFHGWTFDSDGSCKVDSIEKGSYPEVFHNASHDLNALAHVAEYRGFIFGSLNPDVDPLVEHLGEASKIIDMMADQSEEGLEVLKGEIRYTCKANWKTQLENIDGYHFFPTHLSYIGLTLNRSKSDNDAVKAIDVSEMEKLPGGAYEFINGHYMNWGFMPNGDDRPLAFRRQWVADTYGKARERWMVDYVRNLVVYPNLLLMDQSSTTIRMIHPISVDKTLVEVYCIAPKGEPTAARERRVRQFEDFLGPAGMATPDDLGVFEATQKSMLGTLIPKLQGYSRGQQAIQQGANENADTIGLKPEASSGIDHEAMIHGAYRQWKKLMRKGLQEH